VQIRATRTSTLRTTRQAAYAAGNGDERPTVDDRSDQARRLLKRAAWGDDPAATKEVSTVSEVHEDPPTSFVIVELARPPRQAFRFAEQADALRLAERLRRADPDAAVRTETPEEARAVLLEHPEWAMRGLPRRLAGSGSPSTSSPAPPSRGPPRRPARLRPGSG
jgi:hypothetical protein